MVQYLVEGNKYDSYGSPINKKEKNVQSDFVLTRSAQTRPERSCIRHHLQTSSNVPRTAMSYTRKYEESNKKISNPLITEDEPRIKSTLEQIDIKHELQTSNVDEKSVISKIEDILALLVEKQRT